MTKVLMGFVLGVSMALCVNSVEAQFGSGKGKQVLNNKI